MKKLTIFAVFAAAAASLSAATIAEWDLSKGLKSADGKFELKMRNPKFVQQTAEGMVFSAPGKDIDAGLATVKRYSELTPAGAFELEMTFKADFSKFSPNTKRKEAVIFDSKYYFNTKPGSKKAMNSGFMVRLRFGKNSMQPGMFIGYGDHTKQVAGKWFQASSGFHTLRVSYDPSGFVSFQWDDRPKQTVEF